MNEQISWNAVSAIIGVIVGFVLYEVAEWWKNKRKKPCQKRKLSRKRKRLSEKELSRKKEKNRQILFLLF